uniref:NADH-ubiquinone oxidoreductase chain 4L n=1 Tax=Corynis lateralis TaxID=1983417 RepID=A0A1W6Q567_9HYME|nr:NADH dehydrogenase subunit 4L [Corynis lateralis]
MSFILYLFLLIFFIGFFSLSLNRFHLLMILLNFEFLILILFFFMMLFLTFYGLELYFSLIFLVFSVSEGVLGLSILILLIRSYGNDYFQILNLL